MRRNNNYYVDFAAINGSTYMLEKPTCIVCVSMGLLQDNITVDEQVASAG